MWGRRFWSGVVLIILGGILLANTLGYLPWSAWGFLGVLWPVLLVVAGIELLFLHRISGSSLMAIGLIIVIVGGIVWGSPFKMSVFGWSFAPWWFGPWTSPRETLPAPGFRDPREVPFADEPRTETICQPLPQGVDRAKYDLKFGTGKLKIGSARELLIDARIQYSTGRRPEVRWRTRGSEAEVTIRQPEAGPPGANWDIGLTDSVPLSLRLETGACDAELDLSKIKVTELSLDAGASKLRLVFGESGLRTEGKISAGASKVELVVPKGIGLRIKSVGALSTNNFERQGMVREDSYWVSEEYGKSPTTIDIEVSAGVSTVTLER